MSKDGKYVVFKIDDWLDMWKEMKKRAASGDWEITLDEHPLSDLQKKRLDDAVVIRRQDVFAAPALHTYSSMIAIALRYAVPGETRGQLQQVADYFHEQAVLADDEGRKVPD